jgi:hypothetical protein
VLGWLALLIGSVFSTTVALTTAGLAAGFVLLAGLACLIVGGGLALPPLGPVVYGIIYTAYGLGFLGGLIGRRSRLAAGR